MGPQIQLSGFVGEHGPYQLYITLVLFLRYVFLGLMANSGPLMTPDVTFYCQLPMDEVAAIMPNITLLNQTEQELEMKEEFKRICQLDLHLYQQTYLLNSTILSPGSSANNSLNLNPATGGLLHHQQQQQLSKLGNTSNVRECTDFTYEIATDQGRTMTSEFDLVCDRDWLRSFFQSLISAAIVVAYVFWGTFSDKYGRFRAQKLCLLVSLIAGGLSIFAMDFWTFVLARALCSFGDLGLVVSLTTTVVELVGNRYRGISVAAVNFGYALGVTLLPYIVAYFEDFRLVVAFTVFCHLLTMPLILTTNESIRWLITNRKFHSAKKELKRIARWNKSSSSGLFEFCIRKINAKPTTTSMKHEQAYTKTSTCEESAQQTAEHQPPVNVDDRQAFESLFKQFIDQIESQNMCDPFGDSPSPCESTSPHESSITASNPSPQPAQCPAVNRSSSLVPEIYVNKHVGGEKGANLLSSSDCHLNPREAIIVRDCSGNGLHLPDTYKRQLVEAASMLGNNLLLNSSAVRLVRTASCGQIDCLPDSGSRSNTQRLKFYRSRETMQSLCSVAVPVIVLTKAEDGHSIEYLKVSDDYAEEEAFRVRNRAAQQPDCINLVASQLSFVGRVSRLFKDKKLMTAVFTIVWTTFNSELQYTSYIIINLEVGEDIYLNYVLGGCMEALAAISASLLLSYAPRRQSLIAFWLLISLSCFGLSVAHIDSTWAVWLLASAKFSQSCLSSIASVAAYESFPTFLRQSGSGLVFTLGMLGSVFAPLIFAEFDDHAGMDRVLMTFSVSSLTAAILIYLFLKETRNCELQ